jgi:tRNA nucleotidyltransferase (CCA-adding enzyme)
MRYDYKIPSEVTEVTNKIQEAGYMAYLVGGCVRDVLIGKKPKDWDITTNATPDEICSLFEHSFYENAFGTVGVVNKETEDKTLEIIEVTTFRLEANYSDGRRPDNVTFSQNLHDDLKRRDFTINAIAINLPLGSNEILKNNITDLFGGQNDLKNRIISTVGNPDERFKEDALRMLRAVRLSAELGFTINIETKSSISKNGALLKNIATERIRDEFTRIIMSDQPMNGLMLASELDILQYIAPELLDSKDIKQNKAHSYNVWEHLMRTLQHSATKKYPLKVRLAALFHDIGKPASRRWSEEKKDWTFHGHDVIGVRVTRKTLERLKFPKDLINDVIKLVRWHMFFSDTDQITLSAVRRLVRNVGKENIWDLMNLRISDRIGTGRPKESPYRLRKYNSMVEEAMRDPISVEMLKIDGNRLMEVTHETPGPKIGFILHALLEEVLDDPKKNTSDYLENRSIELAKNSEEELKKLGEQGKNKKNEAEQQELSEIRNRYWVK